MSGLRAIAANVAAKVEGCATKLVEASKNTEKSCSTRDVIYYAAQIGRIAAGMGIIACAYYALLSTTPIALVGYIIHGVIDYDMLMTCNRLVEVFDGSAKPSLQQAVKEKLGNLAVAAGDIKDTLLGTTDQDKRKNAITRRADQVANVIKDILQYTLITKRLFSSVYENVKEPIARAVVQAEGLS